MSDEKLERDLVTVLSWSEFDPTKDTWVPCRQVFDNNEYDIVSCVIKCHMLECDPDVKDLEIVKGERM